MSFLPSSKRPRIHPGHPYLAGSPLLIAHRGGAGLAPENTLAAFEGAVHRWGADMLEMDVRTTLDGVVVVVHDETVDRTTDGRGRVEDLTFREIQELDAGYRFRDPEGKASFKGMGVKIPSFEEVLTSLPGVRMNVEAKDGRSAPGLVDIVLRHGAEDRVLVAAEWERNRRAVLGYPGPWGASRRDITRFFLAIHLPIARGLTLSCDALQVPESHRGIRLLTSRFVEEAHARNLPIHVWTVDNPEDMRRFLRMGVDGIQTDRPDILAPILHEFAGRPLPPILEGEQYGPGSRGHTGPGGGITELGGGDYRARREGMTEPGEKE